MIETISHNFLIEIQYKKQMNRDRVQAKISFNQKIKFNYSLQIHFTPIRHGARTINFLLPSSTNSIRWNSVVASVQRGI